MCQCQVAIPTTPERIRYVSVSLLFSRGRAYILIPKFAEADIAVHGHGDEEYQDRVEEDKATLGNVRVICETRQR